MKTDKIIERIKILLAMASDVGSPNEAAIAAKRARKLMDEHQISLNDLMEKSAFATRSTGPARRFTAKWEQSLAIAIANYNDCIATYISTSGKFQIGFKGYDADVSMCEFIFAYLVETGKMLCSMHMPRQPGKSYNARLGTVFKENYTAEIVARLNELAEERRQEFISTGKELMIVKIEHVIAEFGEGSYKKYRKAAPTDMDAMAAAQLGAKFGKDVPLHVAIDE